MREYLKETVIPKFMDSVSGLAETEIEDALINIYVSSQRRSREKTEEFLRSVLEELNISLDIETLIYLFEALLEDSNVTEHGIVFTPQYIASYICQEIWGETDTWRDDIRVIDPGCGCGIFLVSAVIYISQTYGVSVQQVIENNIYGVDLNEDNVRRCKKVLKAFAESRGEAVSDEALHIVCADSLQNDWNELFGVACFDYIIGNPPYVNTHDMNKDTAVFLKKYFQTTKSGVYNIFYAFIEHAVKFLAEDGVLGYIVPNNFLTIKSAKDLRVFLQEGAYVSKIIDFGDNMVFKPVRTYNCIIFLNHNLNEQVQYCVMEKTEDVKTALKNIEFRKVPINQLDKNGWKLVDSHTYWNLRKIENQEKRIKEFVRTGIATLRDEVYIVDEDARGYYKKLNGIRYDIDREIVKTLYKVPELKSCTNIYDVSRHIIFPYIQGEQGIKLMPEKQLKQKYKNTYKYLLASKNELDSRDKGKPNPLAWYAYGRTQGLNKYGRKLLFPTFADKPKFMLVEDETALFCNGYGVFENDYLALDELMAVLNSSIMHYYVSNTSYAIEGGYFCYQKKYIENFSIPKFSDSEREVLRRGSCEAVDKLLIDKYGLAI